MTKARHEAVALQKWWAIRLDDSQQAPRFKTRQLQPSTWRQNNQKSRRVAN